MQYESPARRFALATFLVLLLSICPRHAVAEEMTLMAVGDILPHAPWQSFESPVTTMMKDVTPILFDADVVVGNLESPLTARTESAPARSTLAVRDKREFMYKTESPDAAQGLRDAGFTVLSLANNHMLDYQAGGMLDTVDALRKAGVCVTGAGEDAAAAFRPGVVSIKGRDIVFLSASDVVPKPSWAEAGRPGIASMKDEGPFIKRVSDLRAAYPDALVVLCLHWGVEATLTPSYRQKSLARKLIDAGADVILGHHPHRLQGVELYKGRPIFYSLGNFQFDAKTPADESMIARLTYRDGSREPSGITVIPVLIEPGGFPRPLGPDEAGYAKILSGLDALCRPFGRTLAGEEVVPLPPPVEDEIPDDFSGI